MINSIKVTNHLEESLTIELMSPEKSGFIVLSIDGLGPSKADINVTEMSGLDGSSFNSARVGTRNIVLQLQFLHKRSFGHPFTSIEYIRQETYKYFPLKKYITIQINADNRRVKAYGYVESNEPDIFSKKEGCVISIICPKSYVYDEFDSVTGFSSVDPLFEFPFSNESLVVPLLEMSDLITETTKNIIYEGDAPIGMLIHIHATGAASGVTLTNTVTLETLSINSTKLIALTGSDIIAGDDFYISTVQGDKYAILIRSSVITNILNTLDSNPAWFMLEGRDNIFAYTATSGLSNLQFEVTNDVAYEGI